MLSDVFNVPPSSRLGKNIVGIPHIIEGKRNHFIGIFMLKLTSSMLLSLSYRRRILLPIRGAIRHVYLPALIFMQGSPLYFILLTNVSDIMYKNLLYRRYVMRKINNIIITEKIEQAIKFKILLQKKRISIIVMKYSDESKFKKDKIVYILQKGE